MNNQIWTIGHSTRELSEVGSMLDSASIELLVDVRSFPGSRRVPQWNKENLERVFGDRYKHLKVLGGRRKALPLEESINDAWRNSSFRGYGDYMQTPEFIQGLQGLLDLASTCRVAFMCSEAVWWRCHRSMIADACVARGWDVWHLGVGSGDKHSLRDFARVSVDGGRVWYPSENAAAPVLD